MSRRDAWDERRARGGEKRGIAVLVLGALVLVADHDARTVLVVGSVMAVVTLLLLLGTPVGRQLCAYVATKLGVR
jgi:hypothetical protein